MKMDIPTPLAISVTPYPHVQGLKTMSIVLTSYYAVNFFFNLIFKGWGIVLFFNLFHALGSAMGFPASSMPVLEKNAIWCMRFSKFNAIAIIVAIVSIIVNCITNSLGWAIVRFILSAVGIWLHYTALQQSRGHEQDIINQYAAVV